MLMKKKPAKTNNFSDFPPSIIGNYYIEIFGDKEIVLTGKTEIIELGETVLKIKCNEHRISLEGENIKIINYSYDGIRIKGIIKKVEFERG